MRCDPLYDRKGNPIGFVCSRGGRRPRCQVPGCRRASSKQCDFPVTAHASGLCDLHLCDRHATPQRAPNTDYCPAHARHADVQPIASSDTWEGLPSHLEALAIWRAERAARDVKAEDPHSSARNEKTSPPPSQLRWKF